MGVRSVPTRDLGDTPRRAAVAAAVAAGGGREWGAAHTALRGNLMGADKVGRWARFLIPGELPVARCMLYRVYEYETRNLFHKENDNNERCHISTRDQMQQHQF